MSKFYKEIKDTIENLEAKLADKSQKIAKFGDNYARLDEKYDFLQSAHEAVVEESLGYEKEIKQLKQQLAEKEKEIKKLNLEAQKYYEDAYCNDFHNQDKISFAVEQLEKVKKELEFNSNNNEWITARDDRLLNGICDYIDNQINVLKEKK